MASRSFGIPIGMGRPVRAGLLPRIAVWPPETVAVMLVLAFALAAPRGYTGGGSDDWPYLEAARCWAQHGFCVPDTHWAARWPLVAPLGTLFAMFGESRALLTAVSTGWAILAVAVFARLVQRVAGHGAAWRAAAVLAITPTVAASYAELNVDIVELALALTAGLFALRARADASPRDALASGIALALAIQTRTTSVALLPAIALLVLTTPRPRRALILAGLAGLAIPLTAEALVYAATAGDPLLGWHLALGHVRIPSTELAAGVDTRESPLFNPHYIAGWHRPAGIHVHWAIDGLLNLLATAAIGPVLLMAALFGWTARARLPRQVLVAAALFAVGYVGLLTYGLAIDPKPRMFLPVIAAAALVIGMALAANRGTTDARLALLMLALVGAIALAGVARVTDPASAERTAQAWIGTHPDRFAVDETTRRALAFSPAIQAIPRGSQLAPARLTLAQGPCPAPPGGEILVRAFTVPPLGLGRLLAALGAPPAPLTLCRFDGAPDRAGSLRRAA